jgi:aspartate/methionine/tyrosine aminotransferase
MDYHVPAPIERLRLPERAPTPAHSPVHSLVDAERELDALAAETAMASGTPLLNLTYADTHRFPPPAWVVGDFVAAARGNGMTYTPYRGDRGVRVSLAANVSAFLGVDLDPDRELMLTPGTEGALFAALAAAVHPGDTALIIDPDYLANERTLRFLGARVEHVPLHWEDKPTGANGDGVSGIPAASGPTPDLEVLRAALARKPRVLLFSHPNNPTGAVFAPDVIRQIAELVRDTDVVVVADELYSRLVYDGKPFAHLIAEAGMKDHCVTLIGPSKTESMSGYRVGAAVGPAALIDAMEDVQSVTALRAPAYAQHTLVRWLAEDHDFVRRRVADYQRLRDLTVMRLSAADAHARIRVVPAVGTAYLFPHVVGTAASDQEIAMHLVREARVVINPGYQFGPAGAGHFRICFAQDETVWEAALDRVIQALEALPATMPASAVASHG